MFLSDCNGSARRMPVMLNDFSRLFEPLEAVTRSTVQAPKSFAVDVRELERVYQIVVDLPGVARDQVDLSLEERVLEIAVNTQLDQQIEGKSLLQERRAIKGTRKFVLPEVASEDGIEASLEKGVLMITVPKQAKKEPLKISVS